LFFRTALVTFIDVIPAKAAIHLEIAKRPQGRRAVHETGTSGWPPAFAGVTSSV